MKILIIEDDFQKCSNIIQTINKVSTKIVIETSNNIFHSKKLISKTYYDLLILDLNLPYEENGECESSSGFQLIEEIKKVGIYKKPRSILVITAYQELHEKYKDSIDKDLFKIIKFSSFDSQWSTALSNHINYLIDSEDSSIDISANGYNIDAAIITAVDIENIQVLNILEGKNKIKLKDDPTYYTKGYFTGKKDRINVITATQHQMGIAAASILTLKLIINFRPKYICMAGIAAGKKGEGNFGDIIIPTEVWDYGSGKLAQKNCPSENENNNFLFKPDPKYLPLDVELKEILNKDYRKVLDIIKNEFPADKPETSLKVIKGPMACGSIVVQNESIIEKYIDPHNRKLKGIDMESYGIFYASENSFMPKPKALVCKSICDFADSTKNDKYQVYAAYTSVQFLRHLLVNELF